MYIITGSASGVGEYLFDRFKEFGAAGVFRNKKPANLTENHHRVDLTDDAQVEEFARKMSGHNSLVLIHCAGTNVNGFAHKMSVEDWDKVLEGNLTSAFCLARHFLPLMRKQGYGRIIFFTSVVPQLGIPGTPAYAAAKAGLWGLAKTISKENATKNVTCNCLNLGYMDLGMTNTEIPAEMLPGIIQTIPMKKLGDPINIYNAVKFLIYSDYITGTTIDINGGLV